MVSRPREQWIRVEGTHEPIIDMELWNNVQKRINSHARADQSTGKVHTFSQIAVCMYCGYALRSHKCHDHYYLQCETRYISKSACPGAFIPEAELNKIVSAELRKFNQKLLDMGALERKVQFEYALNSRKLKLLAEKKRYYEKIDECNMALRQLYADKASGIIAPKDYLELSPIFQKDKLKYEELISSCDRRIQEIENCIRDAGQKSELLAPYVTVERLPRRMVELLIERIEVGKRDRETGKVPVSVYWSF